ncbi:DNA ligase (ATP) [Cerrena zonata]|uniref:DNA ligase n=1 Tax=Cerrena zonata TaxID=2478898 RepID=A0AAW0G3Z1_9APHY
MLPTPAPSSPPSMPAGSSPPPQEFSNMDYLPPPKNKGSVPFHVLSALFDRLQTERKPEKRRKLLDTWFNHWREEIGYDLYPVLRLILPQKDRERAVYGLKEKNLAKMYIKLIPLQPKDSDSTRLLNWKRPSDRFKTSGDFPNVLYEVVCKRSSIVEGTLSVEELNDVLDQLAANIGKSDNQARIMQRVYNRTTAEEQRWIVRIILKDMVISVKETTVFAVFHPDAHDLYNTCSDLKKVVWELWDPKRRLGVEDKAVQLFRAFAPMLCKRPTRKIEESVKEMEGRTFVMEEKLDGERIQLHKRGNEYFYCSRKGKDYTYLYGKHVGTGSLTPYIDDAFDPRITSIILDGEMLVWDPVSEKNLPFGTLKTAALDKNKKEHNPRPCFKVFDLLYLNGQSLLHKSLKFRRRNLKACIEEVKGRLEFTIEFEGKTAQDVRERMEVIMANKGEGLVMKHPDSEYILNGRNKDWIKVKPEYMDNLGETVDVLVVAGNYGSGRRSGGVSTLICAALDDRRKAEEDEEPKYSTFVRVGSGFSFSDFVWIRAKRWKEWDPKAPPTWLQVSGKGPEDKGDVYLEPEDSFILKVKAAEIVSSELYHMGCTMRFPRALNIRDDLSLSDCMTASGVFDSMRAEKKRKMEEDQDGTTKKKRKVTKKVPTVLPQYEARELADVKAQSRLFKGYTFVVSSDPKSKTGDEDKAKLQKLIRQHGGKIAQVPRSQKQMMVVYDGPTIPYDLKLVINKGALDVIKPIWILDCVTKAEILPLRKKYFFHATDVAQVSEEYDEEDDEEDLPVAPDDEDATSSRTVSEAEDEAVPEPIASSSKSQERSQSQTRESFKETKIDPSLAEWLMIDESQPTQKRKLPLEDDSETEPEPDSDNDDVQNEDADVDDDDWLNLPNTRSVTIDTEEGSNRESQEWQEVKMGEDDEAMHYDQDMIFRHLCFYLDTPTNAKKNDMVVKTKQEDDIAQSLAEIEELITKNGGKIVELDNPKLTHIVLDQRDVGRRIELMTRTSKPKRRNIVISDWIQACLDEETLLDEESFMP